MSSARAARLALRASGRRRSVTELTAQIAAAFVARNPTSPEGVALLMSSVQTALTTVASGVVQAAAPAPALPKREPAVPIRKSITPSYLICLEDGRKLKSMKRHLRAKYGLTPDEYRRRWGLPADYPMVAPDYSARRTELAKENGLGRRGRDAVPAEVETPVSAPAKPLSVNIAETFVDGGKGIVCLNDGRVVKDLGRHLRRHFDQSADEYRAQHGLPALYPMKVERIARFLAGQS